MTHSPSRGSSPAVLGVALVCVAVAAALLWWLGSDRESSATHPTATTGTAAPEEGNHQVSFTRMSDPGRTVARDGKGTVLATFTDRARTATLLGPRRLFDEPEHTDASVATATWVRLLPEPWAKGAEKDDWFDSWFARARADRSPDVLQIATQYFADAPDIVNDKGLRIAGNSSFGPEESNGKGRGVGSDFYDYLGIDWTFDDGITREAQKSQLSSLDCSGYVRMVFGYRLGYPLYRTNQEGSSLPRRARAMALEGPGAVIIDEGKDPVGQVEALLPGDLVFFATRGGNIDHSGIYLGVDDAGQHRFMSSRQSIDGPTMGDASGPSVIDADQLFGRTFRMARRI